MSFSTVAALLESEHDLLSVLLVRAERLADNDDEGLRHAIAAVCEELAGLELTRAIAVAGLGVGDMPSLPDLIHAAPPSARSSLASALHELVLIVPQVDEAAESAALQRLVPRSLRDFLKL